jgi:hypothetical protein
MSFDKTQAVQIMQDLIKRQGGVIAGYDAGAVRKYGEDSKFARGFARFYKLDFTMVCKALIAFDHEWGQKFEDQYHHAPTQDDWIVSFLDRGNQFADLVEAVVPFKDGDHLAKEYGGVY